MSTCLTTKLDGIVNDSSLYAINEFRVKVKKQSNYKKVRAYFIIRSSVTQTIHIINETEGNNYFYDANDTNLGKSVEIAPATDTTIYCSNGTYEISIPDKYNIVTFSTGRTYPFCDFFSFDSSTLAYLTRFANLCVSYTAVKGNLKAFAANTNMLELTAEGSKIEGDIKYLKNLTSLLYFRTNNCSEIYGDIAVCYYLPDLRVFEVGNSYGIYGDIAAFTNCLDLEWLNFNADSGGIPVSGNISALANHNSLLAVICENKPNITGDIAVFKTNTNSLSTLYFWNTPVSGDIAELAPCNRLVNVRLGDTAVTGDLSVFLADKPNLQYIDIQVTGISGDITNISIPAIIDFWVANSGITGSIGKVAFEGLTDGNNQILPAHAASDGFVKHCPSLISLSCVNTQLSGDIDVFANCESLANIQLTNSKIEGDIGSLSTLTNLTAVNIGFTNIHGDLGAGLTNCNELGEIYAENCPLLAGDLSKLGSKARYLASSWNTGPFTWTTTRPSTSAILAMNCVNLGEYLDAMLINQANCQPAGVGTFGEAWSINVRGTHSSDPIIKADVKTAMRTIMGKGYSIYINGILQTEATINNI